MDRRSMLGLTGLCILIFVFSIPLVGFALETVLALLCLPFFKAVLLALWHVLTAHTPAPTAKLSFSPPNYSSASETFQAMVTELMNLRGIKRESEKWFKLYSDLCKEVEYYYKTLEDLEAENHQLLKARDSDREKVDAVIRYCNYYIFNEYGLRRRCTPVKTIDDLSDLFENVKEIRLESSSFYRSEIDRLQNDLATANSKIIELSQTQHVNANSASNETNQNEPETYQQLFSNYSTIETIFEFTDLDNTTDEFEVPEAQCTATPEQTEQDFAQVAQCLVEPVLEDIKITNEEKEIPYDVLSSSPEELPNTLDNESCLCSGDLVEPQVEHIDSVDSNTVQVHNVHCEQEVGIADFSIQQNVDEIESYADETFNQASADILETTVGSDPGEVATADTDNTKLSQPEKVELEYPTEAESNIRKHVRFADEELPELHFEAELPLITDEFITQPLQSAGTSDCYQPYVPNFEHSINLSNLEDSAIPTNTFDISLSQEQYTYAPRSLSEIIDGSYSMAFPSGNHRKIHAFANDSQNGIHAVVESFNIQSIPGTEVLDSAALKAAMMEAGVSFDAGVEDIDLARGLGLWGSNNGIAGLWLAVIVDGLDRELVPLEGADYECLHYVWIQKDRSGQTHELSIAESRRASRYHSLCDTSVPLEESALFTSVVVPENEVRMSEANEDARYVADSFVNEDIEIDEDEQMARLLAGFNTFTLESAPTFESITSDYPANAAASNVLDQQQIPGLTLTKPPELDCTVLAEDEHSEEMEQTEAVKPELLDREMSDLAVSSRHVQPLPMVESVAEINMSDMPPENSTGCDETQNLTFYNPAKQSDSVMKNASPDSGLHNTFTPNNYFSVPQTETFTFGIVSTNLNATMSSSFTTPIPPLKPRSKIMDGKRSRVSRHPREKRIPVANLSATQKHISNVFIDSNQNLVVEQRRLPSQPRPQSPHPMVTSTESRPPQLQPILNFSTAPRTTSECESPLTAESNHHIGTGNIFGPPANWPTLEAADVKAALSDQVEDHNERNHVSIDDERFQQVPTQAPTPAFAAAHKPIVSPEMTNFVLTDDGKWRPYSPPSPPAEPNDSSSESEEDGSQEGGVRGVPYEDDFEQYLIDDDECEQSTFVDVDADLKDARCRLKQVLLHQAVLSAYEKVIDTKRQQINGGDPSPLRKYELEVAEEEFSDTQDKLTGLLLQQTIFSDDKFAEELAEYQVTEAVGDQTDVVTEYVRGQGEERLHEARKAEMSAFMQIVEPVRTPGRFSEQGARRREPTPVDDDPKSHIKQLKIREKVYLRIRDALKEQVVKGGETKTTRFEYDIANENLEMVSVEIFEWRMENETEDGEVSGAVDELEIIVPVDLEAQIAREIAYEARQNLAEKKEIRFHV